MTNTTSPLVSSGCHPQSGDSSELLDLILTVTRSGCSFSSRCFPCPGSDWLVSPHHLIPRECKMYSQLVVCGWSHFSGRCMSCVNLLAHVWEETPSSTSLLAQVRGGKPCASMNLLALTGGGCCLSRECLLACIRVGWPSCPLGLLEQCALQ